MRIDSLIILRLIAEALGYHIFFLQLFPAKAKIVCVDGTGPFDSNVCRWTVVQGGNI